MSRPSHSGYAMCAVGFLAGELEFVFADASEDVDKGIVRAYIQIARPDHWVKNIFVLPGTILAFFFYRSEITWADGIGIGLCLFSACLVASSNYVLNELLDARSDRHHPVKHTRPAASGQVRPAIALAEWLLLAILGFAVGFSVHPSLGWLCVALWIMGIIYNVPPIRAKDLPYADVLTESINNPLRMAMGWYASGVESLPPVSILLAYWMFGAFLMAAKRFAEYRSINDPARAARYRASFAYYSEQRLMLSILYYATLFAMFGGVFIARYQIELILATPLILFAMAHYLHLAYRPDSPAQYPERILFTRSLMVVVSIAFAACGCLLVVDLPWLQHLLHPTNPIP